MYPCREGTNSQLVAKIFCEVAAISFNQAVITTLVLPSEAANHYSNFPLRQLCFGKMHCLPEAVMLFRFGLTRKDASARPLPSIGPLDIHDLHSNVEDSSQLQWGHAVRKELVDGMNDIAMGYIVYVQFDVNATRAW